MVDQLAQQIDGIAGGTVALLQRLMDLGHLGAVAFGCLRVDGDGIRLWADGQFRLQPLLLSLQLHQLAPGDLGVDGPIHHQFEHRLDFALDGGRVTGEFALAPAPLGGEALPLLAVGFDGGGNHIGGEQVLLQGGQNAGLYLAGADGAPIVAGAGVGQRRAAHHIVTDDAVAASATAAAQEAGQQALWSALVVEVRP